ncbi:PqqD family protein [Amycolatopsis silviterrae]|uniref:PqqD family protein n=1 Tax=Amycolatopsis silviterrae TaxID=1656914 RepID=A0ABW5HMG6_9PSEU
MDPSSVPRLSLDAKVRRFRGALLVAVGEETLELTDSAAFLFRAVDGARSVADIGTLLAQEYDVPADEAAEDAAGFLGELVDNGVLELGP